MDKSIGNQKTVKPAGSNDRSMGGVPTLPPRDGARPNADQSLGSVKTMSPGGVRSAVRRFSAGEVILGRYRVTEELGQGGMGVVYRCFDSVAGIDVALKALPPEVAHNSGEMEEVRANFRLVSKLHHPNIANVNTLERDAVTGDYYLIMECVDGYDVRQWVRSRKEDGRPLTLDEVTIIAYRIAEALDYAHEQGVIHRDIKPSNVRVNFEGEVKVLDFGLAAQLHTSLSRVSQVSHGTSGTGPYMAPEQWRGRRQGAAVDQYALAATVYELLCGTPPFEGHDLAILREAVLKDAPLPLEGVPPHVNAALLGGLAKEPEKRFESCAEFVKALAGSRRQETSAISAPAETGVRRLNKAWWLLAVGLAALAGIVYWVYTTYQTEPAGKVEAAANPAVSTVGTVPTTQVQAPVVPAVSVAVVSSMPASAAFESLRRGLILHFSFDNVQSDKVTDESGVGNHGILKGGKLVPGKVGNALLCTFANEVDGVLVKDNYTLDLDAVTMAAWIKTSRIDGENWPRIMDKDYRTAYTLCMGGDYQGKSWRGKVGIESVKKACYSKVAVADDQWHFVVGSYNGRTFKLYIDGQIENVNTPPSPTPICQSDYDLMIGNTAVDYRPPDSIHNQFDGLLDEVRLYNRVLSDDEMRQLYELDNKLAAPAVASASDSDRSGSVVASSPAAPAVSTTGRPWSNSPGMPLTPDEKQTVDVDLGNGLKMEFVSIPRGSITMRSGEVTHIEPFFFAKYKVTQEQWQTLMGNNPSRFKGAKHPVENVNWNDCQGFIKKLQAKHPEWQFALPTRAQWEYAARAGSKNKLYFFGDDVSCLGDYAWYADNSGGTTHPVGQKKPNPWGLYDIHGNLWEWSAEQSPPSTTHHWLKGGSWNHAPGGLKFGSAGNYRGRTENIGFRVMMVSKSSR